MFPGCPNMNRGNGASDGSIPSFRVSSSVGLNGFCKTKGTPSAPYAWPTIASLMLIARCCTRQHSRACHRGSSSSGSLDPRCLRDRDRRPSSRRQITRVHKTNELRRLVVDCNRCIRRVCRCWPYLGVFWQNVSLKNGQALWGLRRDSLCSPAQHSAKCAWCVRPSVCGIPHNLRFFARLLPATGRSSFWADVARRGRPAPRRQSRGRSLRCARSERVCSQPEGCSREKEAFCRQFLVQAPRFDPLERVSQVPVLAWRPP